jgi:hypothetical protein
MNFVGTGERLKDLDISEIAASIGCGEDHLHAVMDVETSGGGWDVENRPKALFEPHIFYRELTDSAERERAVREGLAYRKWGERAYPRDSYPRIVAAMDINREAAIRSTSWGLGQVMGFNARLAGYLSAEHMVNCFLSGEAEQLAGMVNFIVNSGLDDELRRKDWAGFARGYNGSSYAKHGYHTKLAAAFKKWQGIKDTPFNPDRSAPDWNAAFEKRRALVWLQAFNRMAS